MRVHARRGRAFPLPPALPLARRVTCRHIPLHAVTRRCTPLRYGSVSPPGAPPATPNARPAIRLAALPPAACRLPPAAYKYRVPRSPFHQAHHHHTCARTQLLPPLLPAGSGEVALEAAQLARSAVWLLSRLAGHAPDTHIRSPVVPRPTYELPTFAARPSGSGGRTAAVRATLRALLTDGLYQLVDDPTAFLRVLNSETRAPLLIWLPSMAATLRVTVHRHVKAIAAAHAASVAASTCAPAGGIRFIAAHGSTQRHVTARSGTHRHAAARSGTQRHAAARSGTQRHAAARSGMQQQHAAARSST